MIKVIKREELEQWLDWKIGQNQSKDLEELWTAIKNGVITSYLFKGDESKELVL